MKKLIMIAILFNTFLDASERVINQSWCSSNDGVIEYRTKYGTYVDCLTEEYAIEVEFDYNWKESIGQALHYAEATNRSAGILLINRNKSRVNYLEQLNNVIKKYNLPVTIFVTNE
jgi:hypothetical protein